MGFGEGEDIIVGGGDVAEMEAGRPPNDTWEAVGTIRRGQNQDHPILSSSDLQNQKLDS